MDKMPRFMEIRIVNQKLKRSEIAKELQVSSFTLQRDRGETNTLSPYRIPPSSKTQREQKSSNHTEHDLNMTSNENDLKMTSIDLEMSSNKSVKYQKNKL